MNAKYLRECKRMFNHIGVFGGFELCRVIGYGYDSSDNYYHVRKADGTECFNSMVGGFYSIKRMGRRGYGYTERNFSYNSPKATEFTITKLRDDFDWGLTDTAGIE